MRATTFAKKKEIRPAMVYIACRRNRYIDIKQSLNGLLSVHGMGWDVQRKMTEKRLTRPNYE